MPEWGEPGYEAPERKRPVNWHRRTVLVVVVVVVALLVFEEFVGVDRLDQWVDWLEDFPA